ncbi:MAG: hypothetical protein M1482_03620 [Chloroflexi bacterium]|nr:hypothetical protein [Chloroflexota bacterium]
MALDMVRDCCVLGMLLRDRAAGTTHHRTGGAFNDVVAQLDRARQPYTPSGILDTIEQCSVAFDHLAAEWSKDYVPRRQPLLAWIGFARRMMRQSTAP